MKKLKVLIAEDRPRILEILAKWVRDFTSGNVDLDLTNNGAKAVKYVEEGNKYDLIILNIEMPLLDGHQAGARIRKLGYKGPIIGHTGHTDDDAKWYMIKGKMNAIISRPDTGADLHEVMSAFNLCSNEETRIYYEAGRQQEGFRSCIQRNPNLKL